MVCMVYIEYNIQFLIHHRPNYFGPWYAPLAFTTDHDVNHVHLIIVTLAYVYNYMYVV